MAKPNATPAAVELAEKHGVDLAKVKGSGADGKIVVDDVKAVIPEEKAEEKTNVVNACNAPNLDYFKPGLDAEGKPVPGKLLCKLPKGHAGDHFNDVDEDGNPVSNGYWGDAATV